MLILDFIKSSEYWLTICKDNSRDMCLFKIKGPFIPTRHRVLVATEFVWTGFCYRHLTHYINQYDGEILDIYPLTRAKYQALKQVLLNS